jgi:hypothetical protein
VSTPFQSLKVQVLRDRSGSVKKIRLFDGQEKNVNYYCTNVDNDTRPIIWFEADSAHGVLDFIGIQTILAQDYNRTSCSYDPPNFGWSDNLPSSLENFYSYLSPLLLALGQQDQRMKTQLKAWFSWTRALMG